MIKDVLTNYLKNQLTSHSIDLQVYWSILLIATPSIPIYFMIKVFRLQESRYFNLIVHMGIAFSIGALAGDLFGHIIPETFEKIGHHDHTANLVVLGAICFYFVLDKLFSNVADNEKIQSKTKNAIFLLADGLHNLTDGFAIASLYKLSRLTRLRKRYHINSVDLPA